VSDGEKYKKAQKTRRQKARRVVIFGIALAEFLTRPQSVEIKSAQNPNDIGQGVNLRKPVRLVKCCAQHKIHAGSTIGATGYQGTPRTDRR
jgi:hypothetical protein